jgi:hypothetical protein
MRLAGVGFLMVLPLATACSNLVVTTPFTPMPIELTATAKDGGDVETATGVVPPRKGCDDGRIVVTSGSEFRLISRPLANAGPGPFEMSWPDQAPYSLAGWDNQLARLANGDLLLLHSGSSRVPIAGPPSWWEDWFGQDNNPGGHRDGLRSALVLWRASCGGPGSFSLAGAIDAGTVGASDPNRAVAVGYCAQGWPGNGGFDRPDLYVDPWGVDPQDTTKQRVFVSVRCNRFDDDSMVVFVSNDSGASWQPSTIRLPGWESVAMTSTASGRFYMFQCNGETPTLYYSDDHGKTLATQAGYDVSFKDASGVAAQCTWPPGPAIGAGQPGVTPATMVPIAENAVLIGYPSTEPATDAAGNSFTREVEEIVLVITSNQDPIVLPLLTVRAAGPRGSVLQATLVGDEQPAATHVAMLYWAETDDLPLDAMVTMHARYIMFFNALDWDGPHLLGSEAGWLETRTGSQSRGDYMRGAFFYTKGDLLNPGGHLNFAATWPESSQLHGRILTVGQPPRQLPLSAAAMKNAQVAPQAPAPSPTAPKPPCDNCPHPPPQS